MEIGKKFADFISYNENMAKGMEDKLWFVNHLKRGENYTFVDFGCADGTLLNILSQIEGFENCTFIGYDISEAMISFAKSKFTYPTDNVIFTSNWNSIKDILSHNNGKKVLILSSVIHEVYSYANEENDDIGAFWKIVRNTGFDYVCVRDMMCSEDINRKPNDEIISTLMQHIDFASTKSRLKREFEKRWCGTKGMYYNMKYIVHFLLKYRWVINWEREVNENYFPIYISEFIEKFNEKYNLTYFERFRVPFLDKCIKEDFNIELEDYTHIKAFFEIKKKDETES